MQISVDLESCSAHGECVAAAPEIVALSDHDEVVRVRQAEPDESLRASAEAAAEACPMFAITVS